MLLADLGAEVVKVYDEDEVSNVTPGRRVWDRNKVGATIERSRVESVGALDEMVRRADAVLVGTADDIRGYDALLGRGLAPGAPAVWLVMPPYLLGETPWAAERASAGLLHAWLGTAWSQASYDDVPVEISYPLALYMQGIWAATMVVALWLGAERGRASGGLGIVGGAHGAVVLSPGDFFVSRDAPHVHRPGGPAGSLPNYRCYRCADGEWMFLAAFTNAFIERGFRAIGASAVLDDPRIGGNPAGVRAADNAGWVIAALESLFAQRRRAEWIEVLEAADVPVGPVLRTSDWMDDEQVIAMGLRTSQTTALRRGSRDAGPLPRSLRHAPFGARRGTDEGHDHRGADGSLGSRSPPGAPRRRHRQGAPAPGPARPGPGHHRGRAVLFHASRRARGRRGEGGAPAAWR